MKIHNIIKETYEKYKAQVKEFEEKEQKAKEKKEYAIRQQGVYLQKCNVCGGETFFQSRGIKNYHPQSHIYSPTAQLNMVTDVKTYPDGAEYKLCAKVCKQCGNILLYVPFQDIGMNYFTDYGEIAPEENTDKSCEV